MTNRAQKELERWTAGVVLSALGLEADGELEDGEAPDITASIAGPRVGVEVTAYQTGVITDEGTTRGAVDASWEDLKRAADPVRSEFDRPKAVIKGGD